MSEHPLRHEGCNNVKLWINAAWSESGEFRGACAVCDEIVTALMPLNVPGFSFLGGVQTTGTTQIGDINVTGDGNVVTVRGWRRA